MGWMDNWNRFDFVVVVGTDLGLVIKWTTGINIAALATIIRTFRVCRVVRLVQMLRNLRALISTLIVSLPALGNIAALLFLMTFIYAIVGVQQFAKIGFEDALNEHAHFQNFAVAFLTLARSSTGENWNGMMYSMSMQKDGCVKDPPWNSTMCYFQGYDPLECEDLNGCGVWVAHPFWLLFTCMVTFVVLNVFVAVILEAFEDAADAEEAKLTETQWEKFCDVWSQFVPRPIERVDQVFRIDMNELLKFFKALP